MTVQDPLRLLYKSLIGKGAMPLKPSDEYYVPILQASPESDPILALWQRIDLAESESVNLLTGFRGNGKSTELLRLKAMLEKSGCQVFLVNMLDYVLMTKPLALSDFVLSLMAALASEVEKSSNEELRPLSSSYWQRLQKFLETEVSLEDINLEVKGGSAAAKLGFKLKTDPEFKIRIQKHLEGHLTHLVQDAREFVVALVGKIRTLASDQDKKVVFLVDSLEQLRGVGEEASKIYASVVEVFSGQSANLAFPQLHIVYTVPPYLTVLAHNLGRGLGGHPVAQWPNIHVRDRKGQPDQQGLAIMEKIIENRLAGWRDIVPKQYLCRLAQASGGDMRDYFRLIREAVISLLNMRIAKAGATFDDSIIERVTQQLRAELLPIAEEDAQWMARIHASKQVALQTDKDLPGLARFLDSNLIMNYLNGEPWYDVHPLLIEDIERRDSKSGKAVA